MYKLLIIFLFIVLGVAPGFTETEGGYAHFCRMIDGESIEGHRIINFNIENNRKCDSLSLDNVPVYTFQESKVGNFIRELCDTTAKYDGSSCKLFEPLPTDSLTGALLKNAYSIKPSRNINGIVLLQGNPKYLQVLALVNSNVQWLETMGLKKAQETVTLRFRPCDGIMMEPEFCFEAQLTVTPSGKVNIPEFYFGGKSLSDLTDSPKIPDFITAINDWIRQYYMAHHFTINRAYLNE